MFLKAINIKIIKMKRRIPFILIMFISVILLGQTVSMKGIINNSSIKAYDFSDESWVDAFDSLHATMSLRYPFTEWKAIDWEAKLLYTRPMIVNAENASDSVAFLKALSEYLYSIPDGHITLQGLPDYYTANIAGGTFGFNMCLVDDGSVLITAIAEGGQAWEAGMRTGDKILKWNGVNIDLVAELENYNTITNYATLDGRMFSRYLMLGRDSVGAVASVTYSGEDNIEHAIDITAVDDGMQMLYTGFYNTVTDFNSDTVVSYKMLENNIGFLRIKAEMATGETIEEILSYPDYIKMNEAVTYFNDNNVEKLIVDLRNNNGGNDLQGAVSMGLFFQNSSFYEYITSTVDDNYSIIHTLWTDPLIPVYNGEIAVIVDPNCISTGEGLVMMFDRLENANIVSQWGTNGSFGMVDWEPVGMPLGVSVGYPQARSLNQDQGIQIDSDSTLKGGVEPDIKVPLNRETIIQQWSDGIDVQLEYAKSLLLSVENQEYISEPVVYPVPCSDQLTLCFNCLPAVGMSLIIYNVNGQKVMQRNLEADQNVIHVDVSTFDSGTYFWKLAGNDSGLAGKFVVN